MVVQLKNAHINAHVAPNRDSLGDNSHAPRVKPAGEALERDGAQRPQDIQ